MAKDLISLELFYNDETGTATVNAVYGTWGVHGTYQASSASYATAQAALDDLQQDVQGWLDN